MNPGKYSETCATPILRVAGLSKTFQSGRAFRTKDSSRPDVKAVDDVSLELGVGETLALVGESGCGKSTLSRLILGLTKPTAGTIEFDGLDLVTASRKDMRSLRKRMQPVFQDPFGSLHPRRRVGDALAEPWQIHDNVPKEEWPERVSALLARVGLQERHVDKYAIELSGGERQRVAIARALALEPEVLILDEPVSSLDVSIQAQIINLLVSIQEQSGMSYLFISHDLALVRLLADRVAVMNKGRIVEIGEAEEVYSQPQDPYTKTLLTASMALDEE